MSIVSFKSFNETMATLYGDYYVKHGEMKALNLIFGTGVAIYVLTTLYDNFIKDGLDSMEKIPKEKKDKYWQTACVYFTELPERLKASKAFYCLELITSNF